MQLTKRLPAILIIALCVSMVASMDFNGINAATLNPDKIVNDSSDEVLKELTEDNAVDLLFNNDDDIVYTNDGEPIETEEIAETLPPETIDELDGQEKAYVAKIAEDDEVEDISEIEMNLFGIASYEKNGVQFVNYAISNEDEMSEEDIKEALSDSIENTENLTDLNGSLFESVNAGSTGSGHYIHTLSSTLRGKSGWNALKVSTSVEMKRKSKSATIDGKKGSVWDAIARTSFETSGKYRVGNTYTRLSIADFKNQKLLDWGPTGSKSGTVSVGLSGGGAASISYSFSTGNKIKSLSSQSGKYGRWNMTSTSHRKSMTYKPSVRITNTSGKVALDVSHSANHYIPSGWGYQVGTGTTRLYCPDRT